MKKQARLAAEAAPLVDPQARVIDYLRVSVTDRCNYQCTYCIPQDGVARADHAGLLPFEEIAALVRVFADLGVRRLRLTGGEPTVRRDLPALVRLLRAVPGIHEIALSTNGHRLAELAAPLREAGVDRVNISLDSLDPERFRRITRRGDLGQVLAGIQAARVAGFRSIKLNTVAIKGFNDDELGAICVFAWRRDLIPRFIEEMPMAGGRDYLPGALLSAAQIRARIAAMEPGARVVGDAGGDARGAGPARYFRLAGGAEPAQPPRRFGIISPMTEHFCDRCNRLRLSATGSLHACLAYDDAVDLRAPLRAGGPEAVATAIRRGLAGKRDGHAFQLVGLGGPRKAMVQIGG
jgi:cyclic pyranopterin phosphate synthase